jgi:probable rRNA maturation factor
VIEVLLSYDGWRAACPDVERMAERTAETALAEAGKLSNTVVGIVLGDAAAQRQLNRAYRGQDTATNVLAFPLGDAAAPAGAPVLLGDVVLAFETVAREAAEQAKPLADHLRHLIVHGVLHLLGFDHENDTDAAMMEAREVEILQVLGVPDPYRDIM